MGILGPLFLTVLSALALACIVGVAVGKYQVKKAAGQVRGLLTPRERALYAASVLLGVVLLLVGIFYQGPAPRQDEWDAMPPGWFEDGQFEGQAETPVVVMPARGGAVRIG